MGIDILPGHHPRATKTPRYSVVVLRDGLVLKEADNVPLYSVVKLLVEYHVDILAVDSIQEIAASSKDLARLSRVIPSRCKIVEVTRTREGYVSVQELAKRLNINVEPSNPRSTALLNAIAAMNGFGSEVLLPSEHTYILVTKGRTPSQGGASSERFKRSIGASVLQLVREVKERLDEAGLDYDLVVKKGSGGLERGLFIVYAPIDRVRDVITPLKYKNARVQLKPAPREGITTEARKMVILGLDPGTSVGLAVLDLDGSPLLVTSLRTPDREKIVQTVLSRGKPVLIAVDTSKPPEFVKKLASYLNALLYTPERDLSEEEKERLVSEYSMERGVEIPDAHSRDALSAALKAHRAIKPLIEEVESKIRGIAGVSRDEVIVKVLRGKPLNAVLEEVFAKTLASNTDHVVEQKEPVSRPCADVEHLHKKINELESTVKKLEEQLKQREETIKSLELELKTVSRRRVDEECERKVNIMKAEIETLTRLLEERARMLADLKDRLLRFEDLLAGLASGAYLVVAKEPEKCIKGYLYVSRPERVQEFVECARSQKSAIFVPKGVRVDWLSLRVPVIEADTVYESELHVVVKSDVVNKVGEAWKIIDEIEARERRERILKMIREYKESRRVPQ